MSTSPNRLVLEAIAHAIRDNKPENLKRVHVYVRKVKYSRYSLESVLRLMVTYKHTDWMMVDYEHPKLTLLVNQKVRFGDKADKDTTWGGGGQAWLIDDPASNGIDKLLKTVLHNMEDKLYKVGAS